jgi:hypothetical protein
MARPAGEDAERDDLGDVRRRAGAEKSEVDEVRDGDGGRRPVREVAVLDRDPEPDPDVATESDLDGAVEIVPAVPAGGIIPGR